MSNSELNISGIETYRTSLIKSQEKLKLELKKNLDYHIEELRSNGVWLKKKMDLDKSNDYADIIEIQSEVTKEFLEERFLYSKYSRVFLNYNINTGDLCILFKDRDSTKPKREVEIELNTSEDLTLLELEIFYNLHATLKGKLIHLMKRYV